VNFHLAYALKLRKHQPAGRARAQGEEIAGMAKDNSKPSTGADGRQESQPASSAGFDGYRSLAYSNVRIIVAKDVVPPFRFKAGGWELSQSSIEVGPATQARIAENGFFMFRVSEDQTGGTELTDLPSPSQSIDSESHGEWVIAKVPSPPSDTSMTRL
jgi:hypothetical protein